METPSGHIGKMLLVDVHYTGRGATNLSVKSTNLQSRTNRICLSSRMWLRDFSLSAGGTGRRVLPLLCFVEAWLSSLPRHLASWSRFHFRKPGLAFPLVLQAASVTGAQGSHEFLISSQRPGKRVEGCSCFSTVAYLKALENTNGYQLRSL